jgi:Amino acid permease
VIGSMLIGVVLYVALQLAFTSAIEPHELRHGWEHLVFGGKSALYGPFAGLATVLGLSWLATLLYTDAIISPGGTGLLYVGTSSRLSYALGRSGYVPPPFRLLGSRGVPVFAIAFSFLCGIIVFLPFPGWQQLVGFITSATVLSYAMVPVSLGALRRQDPDRPRPFRLPGAAVLSPVGFIAAGEVLLFSGWAVVWKLVVAILIGLVLLGNKPRDDALWRSPASGLAPRRLAAAVPGRHGGDQLPGLIQHGRAELDPARRPARTAQRPHLRLGRARDRSPLPRRLCRRHPAAPLRPAGAELRRRGARGRRLRHGRLCPPRAG